MNKRPASCAGCSLDRIGYGFSEPQGSKYADLLVLQDSPEPAAEQKLETLLKKVGLYKEHARTHSLLSCKPPKGELTNKPWTEKAIWHCDQYLKPVLQEQHKVMLTAGSHVSRTILKQGRKYDPDEWHGCPSWVDGRWVLPTYNPMLLLEGKHKLTGVVLFDLLRLKSLLDGTFQEEPALLIVDPYIEHLEKLLEQYLEELKRNPQLPLVVDVETVKKLKHGDEDDVDRGVLENEIVRINFSWDQDVGITFPWHGEYILIAKKLLASSGIKVMHNKDYDHPLLEAAEAHVLGEVHDTMGCFKILQSDLPRSLGFIAPFYSRYIHPKTKSAAWKHLSGSNPEEYAAIDAFQTLRIFNGLRKDLEKSGQWDVAYKRHSYELRTKVLEPATQVGLYVNPVELEKFGINLQAQEEAYLAKIQLHVGDAVENLEGNWKKAPKDRDDWFEREVELEVLCCTKCLAVDVGPRHKCRIIKDVKKSTKPKKIKKLKAEIS